MEDLTIIRYFEDLFQTDRYRLIITEVGTAYPDQKSIIVDFEDIDESNRDLATYLLLHPVETLQSAEETVHRVLPPDIQHPLHVRIHNLPKISAIPIQRIRNEHVGKLVSVSGIVRKSTTVRSKILEAHFVCSRCGFENEVYQINHRLQEPYECQGCGKSAHQTRFQFLEEASIRTDYQVIHIQENPENLEGGDIPEPLRVIAEDDLAGILGPGNRCTITGIIMTEDRSKRATPSTVQDYVLIANHIEKDDNDYLSIEISSEEEVRIMKLSRDPEIFEKLTRSIASSIFGEQVLKEALLLQQFGGIRKPMPDGSNVRGDIHILLIGDPGTAKSQILRIISKAAPRGMFASGQAATKAGLTAAAIQDEGGRWTFEAGALPLADLGMIAIDELDKMDPEDRSSTHEALEQQEITINKAGMNVTLYTRCPVLAAANPKHGRFDPEESFISQVNLPPTLLTRFDLIFAFLDEPDQKRDGELIDKLLADMRGDFDLDTFDPDLLKKYISYAKVHVSPEFTTAAALRLKKFYLQQRRSTSTIQITVRQFQALTRLSEASARVRLSNTVEEQDAERAIRIYGHAIARLCFQDGFIDIDRIEIKKPKLGMLATLRSYLSKHSPVSSDTLVEVMEDRGFNHQSVTLAIKRLLEDGEAWEGDGKIHGV